MIKTLQITLQASGGNAYIMQYPETVNVSLELGRSSDWWGVFLSVVESFQAIKQDRDFLIDAFAGWEAQGWTNDYFISIDIAVREYGGFNSIYKGFAIPDYEDDTNYIKCKFQESSQVQKFLDGTIDRSFNMAEVRELYTPSGGVQGVYDVINQNPPGNYISPLDNPNGYFAINSQADKVSDPERQIVWPTETSYVNTNAFAKSNNIAFYNFIGSKDEPANKSFFFDSDNQIILPKQSKLFVRVAGGLANFLLKIAPYAQNLDNTFKGAETFELELSYLNAAKGEKNIKFYYSAAFSGDAGGYLPDLDHLEGEIQNPDNITQYASLKVLTSGLIDLNNHVCTYAGTTAPETLRSLKIDIVYETLNNNIDILSFPAIINGLFAVDIANSNILAALNNYALFPNDGAISGNSEKVISLNITEFLSQMKKALSIGVTVDPESQQLTLKYIPELFTDQEVISIDESNVFSVSTSLNEVLKVGSLALGANDRSFNYYNNRVGQNIKTNYNARNAFTGTLDLSLTAYKAQMYDFIDTFRDDVFNLSEQDKNDGEIVLFNKRGVGDEVGRYSSINGPHTAPAQVAAWSWLLQVIAPNGFDSESESNNIVVASPVSDTIISLSDNIEPTNTAFTEEAPRITNRKINAEIKLTSAQYKALSSNRDGYVTLNYKDEVYQGYINNLVLSVGKNMYATIELLEKYIPGDAPPPVDNTYQLLNALNMSDSLPIGMLDSINGNNALFVESPCLNGSGSGYGNINTGIVLVNDYSIEFEMIFNRASSSSLENLMGGIGAYSGYRFISGTNVMNLRLDNSSSKIVSPFVFTEGIHYKVKVGATGGAHYVKIDGVDYSDEFSVVTPFTLKLFLATDSGSAITRKSLSNIWNIRINDGTNEYYYPLSEAINDPLTHIYHDVSGNGNHITLVNGSLDNNGLQNDYHYNQLGYYNKGTQLVPLLEDKTAFADGTALSGGVVNDGTQFINSGTKLQQPDDAQLKEGDIDNIYFDTNGNQKNVTVTDIQTAIANNPAVYGGDSVTIVAIKNISLKLLS